MQQTKHSKQKIIYFSNFDRGMLMCKQRMQEKHLSFQNFIMRETKEKFNFKNIIQNGIMATYKIYKVQAQACKWNKRFFPPIGIFMIPYVYTHTLLITPQTNIYMYIDLNRVGWMCKALSSTGMAVDVFLVRKTHRYCSNWNMISGI